MVSSVSQSKLSGVYYSTVTTINGDEICVNLSEKEFQQPTIYDINPLIYFRFKKPLKKDAVLPTIDLKNYYKDSAAYGIDISIEPNFEYTVNDQLI